MNKNNQMFLSVLFLKSFFTMLRGLTPIWGGLTIFIGIIGMYIGIQEGIGWWDGVYFGFVTGTTIGYGDIYPTKSVTRCLSIIIGVVGIINTGLIVAMAVNAVRLVAEYTGIAGDIQQELKKNLEYTKG